MENLSSPSPDLFRLLVSWSDVKQLAMITTKIFLSALGLAWLITFNLAAGEFPDSWTWDRKAEVRAKHAALEGRPMPSLKGLSQWLNGEVKASELKGKVVIVDFYATWCGPCMRAIPHNNELHRKYAGRGLVVIGVCTSSRGQDRFESNAREYRIAYPVARDATRAVEKLWQVSYYPTYAAIDRKGILRAIGLQPNRVEAVVEKLLAESGE